jgi:hypothetical protein
MHSDLTAIKEATRKGSILFLHRKNTWDPKKLKEKKYKITGRTGTLPPKFPEETGV